MLAVKRQYVSPEHSNVEQRAHGQGEKHHVECVGSRSHNRGDDEDDENGVTTVLDEK